MAFKTGDFVSLRHYSANTPIKSHILEVTECDRLLVKLTSDFIMSNFSEGDPIVLIAEPDENIMIFGCNIEKINNDENFLYLHIDCEDSQAEKRMNERYPVSLYSDIKVKGEKQKYLSVIKDISYYGMMIYSKADLPLNSEVHIDIYLERTIIFLKARILRKVKNGDYFEYGLGILYEDGSTMNFMREYIKRMKIDLENALRGISK